MTNLQRIEQAREAAEQAFWAVIAEKFPEAKSGDVDFAVQDELERVSFAAAAHWVEMNTNLEIES